MKKLFVLGVFLVIAVALCAQNNYFIFIQSENNQPYYVHTGGKTISSSSIGHLIIPGLRDSIYAVNIGFPKSDYPEQAFEVPVNKKDGGYQLKNLGADGWALMNMQTLQLVRSQQYGSKKSTLTYGDVKKTDRFSILMAGLVNDSAVLYTSIVKAEPPKENSKSGIPDVAATSSPVRANEAGDSSLRRAISSVKDTQTENPSSAVIPTATKDSAKVSSSIPENTTRDTPLVKSERKEQVADEEILKNETAQAPADTTTIISGGKDISQEATPARSEPAVVSASPKAPVVTYSETKTEQGTEMVFLDRSSAGKTDTIRILIPLDTPMGARPIRTQEDAKPAQRTEENENQKSSPGNFLGKLFGNKDSESSRQKKNADMPPKESTITVTTVEKSPEKKVSSPKSDGTGVAASSSVDPDIRKDSTARKGGVLDRLFGKKNNQETQHEMRSSDVSVNTVEKEEAGKDARTATPAGNEEASEEVKKLRKAQEQEEKTSTERFFGRIFKKNKREEQKDSTARKVADSDQVSIKVTDVPTAARLDTARSQAKEKMPVITNSDCSAFATDTDIDKLKIKLLSRKDIDGQMAEARKFFKSRCLSTNQVKALSTLYKTDAEKYRLFDTSYPFVSDSSNFMDLVVLLNEPYYINRFIAMVRM